MAFVAEAVGIAFQQLQKYEAGQNRVSAAILTRLAEVLKIDAADLLPGVPKATRTSKSGGGADGMALQLQQAFAQIKSKRERQLILELARRLAANQNSSGVEQIFNRVQDAAWISERGATAVELGFLRRDRDQHPDDISIGATPDLPAAMEATCVPCELVLRCDWRSSRVAGRPPAFCAAMAPFICAWLISLP